MINTKKVKGQVQKEGLVRLVETNNCLRLTLKCECFELMDNNKYCGEC